MLWLIIMVLLILWLLGYGYAVGGVLIHLVLGCAFLLLLIMLLKWDPTPVLLDKLFHRRKRGIVRFFNPDRGFGFIERKHGRDVFFLVGDADARIGLQQGAEVEFDLDGNRLAATAKLILPVRQQQIAPPFILSISRNPRLLAARSDALALAGYTVASLMEPNEAAILASQQPFDAIVVGHSVEHELRENLIRTLRDLRPYIPIVFVYTEPDKAEEVLADASVNVTVSSTPLVTELDRRLR
jgi:cold shock CspA family protein